MGKCQTPVRTGRTSERGPEPSRVCPDPWGGPRTPCARSVPCTTRSKDRTCIGPWAGPSWGSGDNTCPDLVWCRPVRLRHCSPPGRRPDAATWPTTCDVSRRAEPDVRPPGYTAPTFIANKACRLSAPLTGDVPPQHLMSLVHSAGRDVSPRHLMCPIHSTGRRRPGRPAGGVPVHSVGRQYAHAVECTVLIITCTGKLPLHANATQTTDIRAQGDCTGNRH
jgi:hypothetical protein